MTTNPAASVRQRLLNLARSRGEDFQRILTQFALERLLYRLGRSPQADQFTLKGALLFLLWMEEPHRRTKDLDLLGTGDPSPERLADFFRRLCTVDAEEIKPSGGEESVEDGLVFDAQTVSAAPIREDNIYGGVRVRLTAFLDTARIAVQVDVGFGDAVAPTPEQVSFPTLLGFPAPTIRAYARETVIAEKLSALVTLGLDNSRMKDFYDLWVLGHQFPYEGRRLGEAVEATFARRSLTVAELPPVGLSALFAEDAGKKAQWRAFVRQSGSPAAQALTLAEVVQFIAGFLLPVLQEVAAGSAISGDWRPGRGWDKKGLNEDG